MFENCQVDQLLRKKYPSFRIRGHNTEWFNVSFGPCNSWRCLSYHLKLKRTSTDQHGSTRINKNTARSTVIIYRPRTDGLRGRSHWRSQPFTQHSPARWFQVAPEAMTLQRPKRRPRHVSMGRTRENEALPKPTIECLVDRGSSLG